MTCSEGPALKLPNYENAVISETKITGYLLSTKHRDGRSKAEFFTRLGFSSDEWVELMAKELESVVLATDLPEYGLKQGDIGTIVLVHGDGKGYEVEFMTLDGETVAVISLLPSQVRPIGRREIAHARPVTAV
jgi:hypothetical protein